MNTSTNKYDALESLIYQEGLRINSVECSIEKDLLSITLNTNISLRQKLSAYPILNKASDKQLRNYELIGNGTGIHWPELDEDLSLKGFLRDTLKGLVQGGWDCMAA